MGEAAALVSRVSRLRRSRARALLSLNPALSCTKSEEKERLFAVYIYSFSCSFMCDFLSFFSLHELYFGVAVFRLVADGVFN